MPTPTSSSAILVLDWGPKALALGIFYQCCGDPASELSFGTVWGMGFCASHPEQFPENSATKARAGDIIFTKPC
jgi:hypothetical protein